MPRISRLVRFVSAAFLAGALTAQPARADVTVQEQTTFDLSFIKAHGTTTELISSDKQRRDSEVHCEGLMSLVCRNAQNGEIVRLDKDVTWILDPKKKEYRETRFPTAAERQAAEEKLRAGLEKLKQCPAAQQQATPAPDTSKCQMSPPKIESHATDKHASFAGHDARLSQLTLTQSCHNPDTGDTCDFLVTMDSWLTQDEIAGAADRRAFAEAYAKKLGLKDINSQMAQEMQQFLAPYRDSLKDLSAKAADFKGYPLKTSFRIAFGGAQCAAAKNASASGGSNPLTDASGAAGDAASSSAAGAAGSAAGQAAGNAAGNGVAGGILGSAASAFGSKLASGLFAKKSSTPAPAAAPPADMPPNMVQLAQVSMETTSISPAPIPAEQFDIPAGWKLVTPKAGSGESKEFSCPSTGK
jgi:hypothetical protein